MAKERTTVRMQAQIKILSEQGHSIRSIARILRLLRRTVRKFLEPVAPPAGEAVVGWRRLPRADRSAPWHGRLGCNLRAQFIM
jgi:hypothetical protein